MDPGEFDGASIGVFGEKDDPFPSTVISLEEKSSAILEDTA